MERALLGKYTPDERTNALHQTHGLMTAAGHTMLELIVVCDEQEDWRQDGATSMTAWLVQHYGISLRTASEWVRVAHALEQLPAIATAHAQGRLSFDQTRALTRFATPETDEGLAKEAPELSAARLELAARRARAVTREEADEAHRRRSVKMYWDLDNRWLNLSGRLPEDQGAVVAKALERVAEQMPPQPSGVYDPYDSRLADALTEVATARLARDSDADLATVVVHVDAAALEGGGGVAELEQGPAVGAETVRRMACDGRIEMVVHGSDGEPIGIGRKSRKVPHWLARALRRRDQGCRFPGCGRTRLLKSHHIDFWVGDEGPTQMDNLVSVCWWHHRLVHEGGFKVAGDPRPGRELRFYRPRRPSPWYRATGPVAKGPRALPPSGPLRHPLRAGAHPRAQAVLTARRRGR